MRSHLWQLLPIVVADDGVGDSQPVDVALDALEPVLVDLVRKDGAWEGSEEEESMQWTGML